MLGQRGVQCHPTSVQLLVKETWLLANVNCLGLLAPRHMSQCVLCSIPAIKQELVIQSLTWFYVHIGHLFLSCYLFLKHINTCTWHTQQQSFLHQRQSGEMMQSTLQCWSNNEEWAKTSVRIDLLSWRTVIFWSWCLSGNCILWWWVGDGWINNTLLWALSYLDACNGLDPTILHLLLVIRWISSCSNRKRTQEFIITSHLCVPSFLWGSACVLSVFSPRCS